MDALYKQDKYPQTPLNLSIYLHNAQNAGNVLSRMYKASNLRAVGNTCPYGFLNKATRFDPMIPDSHSSDSILVTRSNSVMQQVKEWVRWSQTEFPRAIPKVCDFRVAWSYAGVPMKCWLGSAPEHCESAWLLYSAWREHNVKRALGPFLVY